MSKARLLKFGTDGKFEIVEVESLDDFYNALECDCFDVAYRKVGDKYFDIFVDDNGLLKEKPIPTAIDLNMQVALVGNLLFANHDDQGETTSLSDEDIEMIKRHVANVVDMYTDDAVVRKMIFPVEY